MNNLFSLLPLALCAFVLVALVITWAAGFNRPRRSARVKTFLTRLVHAPVASFGMALANVAEGQALSGQKTYISDAVIATRFLIAKIGSGVNNVNLAVVADTPIGIIQDAAAAIGDPVVVGLLGACSGTQKVAINSNVNYGDLLVADASSYARTLPTADGTYWVIGRAIQSGAAGDVIEFIPEFPFQVQYASAVPTARL